MRRLAFLLPFTCVFRKFEVGNALSQKLEVVERRSHAMAFQPLLVACVRQQTKQLSQTLFFARNSNAVSMTTGSWRCRRLSRQSTAALSVSVTSCRRHHRSFISLPPAVSLTAQPPPALSDLHLSLFQPSVERLEPSATSATASQDENIISERLAFADDVTRWGLSDTHAKTAGISVAGKARRLMKGSIRTS